MFTKKIYIFLVLSYLSISVFAKDCFWNSPYIFNHFSSKTPYNCARGDIRDSFVKLKGCEPVSIWGLIRHGKRYPGIDFGYEMKSAIDIKDYLAPSNNKDDSYLCAQDVENIKNWPVDNDLFEKIHCLTPEGYQEMFGIGKRLNATFSELLADLDIGHYKLRSAYGHWIEDGVAGFVKGLSNQPLDVEPANSTYDIMSPYETCPKYINEVKRNPNTYYEASKYQESSEYQKVKKRLKKRTGFEDLTNVNITSLYDLCRYTWSGIDNKRSPWCALFSVEDLEVLEYYGDLRHYYRNGHGNPINEIFGRIPLSDLFRTFENVKGGNDMKMTMYFSHATMMDMVYSALGWFKDETPITSTYRNPKRKWRSTKMGVFAGNLIAVLHRCPEDKSEEYKITFYINEEPVTSVCTEGTCSWREFENIFKPFLSTSLDFC